MRILLVGASGVLGRATLPHLVRDDVVGVARSLNKVQLVSELGAEAVVCDVYDRCGLVRLTRRVRPHVVVNFVTDLAAGSAEANNRARREGGANVRDAAAAARASRLVVESVAFALRDDAAQAVDELERSTCAFPGEAVILRFGRLWGPGTMYEDLPRPPAIHVDEAGEKAEEEVDLS